MERTRNGIEDLAVILQSKLLVLRSYLNIAFFLPMMETMLIPGQELLSMLYSACLGKICRGHSSCVCAWWPISVGTMTQAAAAAAR